MLLRVGGRGNRLSRGRQRSPAKHRRFNLGERKGDDDAGMFLEGVERFNGSVYLIKGHWGSFGDRKFRGQVAQPPSEMQFNSQPGHFERV
jgi:hypothetical protein